MLGAHWATGTPYPILKLKVDLVCPEWSELQAAIRRTRTRLPQFHKVSASQPLNCGPAFNCGFPAAAMDCSSVSAALHSGGHSSLVCQDIRVEIPVSADPLLGG